jgi:dGTPase
MNWEQLLSDGRRKKEIQAATADRTVDNGENGESRTEIERDYDRILFSTPVRRLADKTQVFPLDKNDSIRTRLTHSHEVSNLARSIGTALAFVHKTAAEVPNYQRNIPALLATTGLVHDLGNPPFGHQGESAIQSWFKANIAVLNPLKCEQHRQDFLKFEGNAQGFRLVTRLQLLNDDYGLDLTYATLAAMVKYPTPSDQTNSEHVSTKKHGFFAAEQHVIEQVHREVGLQPGLRHPLAYVMEACDDIAHVVLDAEDSIKKGLASFSDLMAFLKHHAGDDLLVTGVVQKSLGKHDEHIQLSLSPAELNDVSMQRFRVYAIGAMVKAATSTFVTNLPNFIDGSVPVPLLENSPAEGLRKQLKTFSIKHGYTHQSVLRIELEGDRVIRGLMDIFWAGIRDRDGAPNSKRKNPFTRFVYQAISENYRRIFENPNSKDLDLPERYRECLLLTDMISGMTDSFAMNLYKDLKLLQGDFDIKQFREA